MTDGRATPGDRRVKSVPAFDKQTRQREAVLRSLRDHPDFISAQALVTPTSEQQPHNPNDPGRTTLSCPIRQ
jgi:hypothetical protein